MNKIITTLIIISYLTIFTPNTAEASLSFGAAGTNNVNYGTATSLDNLTKATVLMWISPVSTANTYRGWINKYNNASTGWEFHGTQGGDGTSFIITVRAATQSGLGTSTTGVLTANAWAFVGATWDSVTPVAPKVYAGYLTSIIKDVTTFGRVTIGAQVDDNAQNLVVGNVTTASSLSANAKIAWVGIWNRVLTVGEMRDQQFHPHVTNGNVLFTYLGYGGTNGLGTQVDLSGKRNTGAITGAVLAPHVPIKPFSFD